MLLWNSQYDDNGHGDGYVLPDTIITIEFLLLSFLLFSIIIVKTIIKNAFWADFINMAANDPLHT